MNNKITIIVIGLYTLIYFIVFIIQKSQIDKIKEINISMKLYMDIFKIDEVKKYVELMNENTMMKAMNLVSNEENVQRILNESINESINEHIDELKQSYISQMSEERTELVLIAVDVIKTQPIDKREEFINNTFPKTKRNFLKMLDDINNNVV